MLLFLRQSCTLIFNCMKGWLRGHFCQYIVAFVTWWHFWFSLYTVVLAFGREGWICVGLNFLNHACYHCKVIKQFTWQ